jgi:PAS domain S-box-containing protein
MSILICALLQRLRDLADQRRMFEALIENSTDFIGIADRQGKPIYLNPAGRRLVGLSPDAPISGLSIHEFYAPSARDRASRDMAKTIEAGSTEGEVLFRHWQTGAEIPVWSKRFIIRDSRTRRRLGSGTVTRDLSDIKRGRDALEAANRELEEKGRALADGKRLLQAIVDFSPNVIAVKDLDGHYLLINRELEQLVGVDAATARDKTDHDLFPSALRRSSPRTDAAVIEKNAPMTTRRPMNTMAPVACSGSNKFPLHASDKPIASA